MAFSARPTSTNELTQLVNQVAHNLKVGTPVTFDGVNYIKSKADNEINCYCTTLVSIVIDADSFYITQTGYVTALKTLAGADTTYIPGEPYFLSDVTAGTLVLTQPTTNGHVIVPCFLPDTATSGLWFGGSGSLIESGSVFAWTSISGPTTLAINNGYIANSGALVSCILPTTFAVGDVVRIVNVGAGGWKVSNTNAGMQQFMGDRQTTLGATGYLASTDFGDAIELLAIAANTQWQVISSMGNITVF